MGSYNYIRPAGADCAKAVGRSLPISTKTSKEICTWIRGKKVARVETMLSNVLSMKQSVPFKSAVLDLGHRKGNLRTGGYPQKATKHILEIVRSAKQNAEQQGLNVKECVVWHSAAQQGPQTMRGGRRYRHAKRTHVEIILKENQKTAKKKADKKPAVKKETPKAAPKKEAPKPAPKSAEKKAEPAKAEEKKSESQPKSGEQKQ